MENSIQNKVSRVSVVLPVFNDHEYIVDAIQSILNQSYANFELIVIDDGSDPPISEVIKEAEIEDSRILVFRQENTGLPRALNAGFLIASGDYCTWTSADNIVPNHYLLHFVNYMQANKKIDLTYSDMFLIDDDGKPYVFPDFMAHFRNPSYSSVVSLPDHKDSMLDLQYNHILACFMMKGALKHAMIMHQNAFGVEDFDFWLRAEGLFFSKFNINYMMYYYRVHKKSLTSKAKAMKLTGLLERTLKLARSRRSHAQLNNKKHKLSLQELNTKKIVFADSKICVGNVTPRVCIYTEKLSSKELVGVLDCNRIIQTFGIFSDKNKSLSLFRCNMSDIEYSQEEYLEKFFLNSTLFQLEQLVEYQRTSLPASEIKLQRNLRERVILVIMPSGYIGGLEKVGLMMLKPALDAGCKIVVVTENKDLPQYCSKLNIEINFVVSASITPDSIQNFVEKYEPDLIILHHATQMMGNNYSSHKKPRVLHVLHNSSVWLSDLEKKELAAKLLDNEYFIFVSNQAAIYSFEKLGISPEKSIVIENFGYEVPSSSSYFKKKRKGRVRFGMVGGTAPAKNHMLGIVAFNKFLDSDVKYSDSSLGIYGGDVDENYTAACKNSPGVATGKIIFHGRKDAFWDDIDVLVLPSLWEGSSLALYEAYIRNKLIITTDIGDARRYLNFYKNHVQVVHGFNAHVFEYNSIGNFVDEALNPSPQKVDELARCYENAHSAVKNKVEIFDLEKSQIFNRFWENAWFDVYSLIFEIDDFQVAKNKINTTRMLLQEHLYYLRDSISCLSGFREDTLTELYETENSRPKRKLESSPKGRPSWTRLGKNSVIYKNIEKLGMVWLKKNFCAARYRQEYLENSDFLNQGVEEWEHWLSVGRSRGYDLFINSEER
jgi:glycosyltransferase involved in cell wall biosynthesis